MKILRSSIFFDTLSRLIFLVFPTGFVLYFLLVNANQYFSILQNQATGQALFLILGMVLSLVFYAFRFRVISTFLILLFAFYAIYKGIDATAIGEFDTFFLSIRFLIFSSLFSIGWLIGALFSRWRYAHYFIVTSVLLSSVLLIAKQRIETFENLFIAFFPAIIFSFYLVFASEQIYNFKEKSRKFWWFMVRRVFLFSILIGLMSFILAKQLKKEFEAAIEQSIGNGAEGKGEGMLQKNKDGSFDLKDYSQLKSNQGRSNELLFAAHIDNFFPGTDVANPLYLTAFYYTKFDTSTETFERDARIPKNDLFEPNVSKIPLYNTRQDTTVIKNGMGDMGRKVVELEVYCKSLSSETYLAPNIGFFVQPIAIEKEFRSEFRSAFRAKGYVSELNSAYFIYNATDPQIKLFQNQRFDVLRKAKGYENVDKRFMAYYTQMPQDDKFQRIAALAQNIAGQAKTTVDKVLALRDYFLSKDEDSNALFSYTDNPGVPDIPSASKLMYFLFESHKGYCAYYAGATLFMLRALGIPSRITVGFMTIDRSDKNKGWYWYYADQAHAWIQVYFPGYGWLDFDTTVGNDEAQQSPAPDGTPPMQPPHAWFASEGQIVTVDTLKKTIKMKVAELLFHDKEYKTIKGAKEILLDVSIANIQKDSVNIDLSRVKIGDSATAVSYADALKKMKDGLPNESVEDIVERMPSPAPMDDIYIKKSPEQLKVESLSNEQKEKTFSINRLLMVTGFILLLLLFSFFGIPYFTLSYYKLRIRFSKNNQGKAYWCYRCISFYLHQLGFFRRDLTPLKYAKDTIDNNIGTDLTSFMNIYLKLKYTNQPINEIEKDKLIFSFENNFRLIKTKFTLKKRFSSFLRPLRSFSFFYSSRF
jgi:hypothetical protein